MGYSSRYHVASLAAVFIALAIGILIGAALGSDIVSGTAENLEDDLSQDLDQVRAENAELREELEFEQSFSAQLAPAVIADRLPAQEVALIGLGDVDTATLRADVDAALEPTGAELTQVGSVREPPDTEALTAALLGSQRDGSDAEDARAGRGARRGAARRTGRSEQRPARRRCSRSSRASPESLDAAVVVRARPEDLAARDESEVEALETGLIRGLREAGVRVVGAEREDTEPSSIEFFADQDLATVDNIDQLPGKVALVLALDGARRELRRQGTADTLLPDLIEPSTAPEAGGG